MRLIDADKLYKYIDDEIYTTDKYAEVEDILDIIAEFAEENTNEWIPVSERLPEYGTEVLTCIRGGYVEIQSLETYGEYWENQHGDWTDFDEVIAWLPLPKPYKAESEDKK